MHRIEEIVPTIQRQILFGTTNQAKIDHARAMTSDWSVQILSPHQLGINIDVMEDGLTAEENAIKKARTYAITAKLPTFAIDAALIIDGFPAEKQPGVFVRRIHQEDVHVTDDAVILYYQSALQACGGSALGQWRVAVAFTAATGKMQVESYTIDTLFTAQPSSVRIAGAPLSSLMLDPVTMRYYTEMRYDELPGSIQLRDTLAVLFGNM